MAGPQPLEVRVKITFHSVSKALSCEGLRSRVFSACSTIGGLIPICQWFSSGCVFFFSLFFFPTPALNSELTKEVWLRKICTVSLCVLPVLCCYCWPLLDVINSSSLVYLKSVQVTDMDELVESTWHWKTLLIRHIYLCSCFHQLKGVYALKRPQENPRWPPKGKVA